MRNVHLLPDPSLMLVWLREAGFQAPRIVDVTPTSPEEQRSTPWMRFESLAAALDPRDPRLTVEGYPRPVRAVAVARKSP
jgi:tRNA (mo5U34)-methyltransferase